MERLICGLPNTLSFLTRCWSHSFSRNELSINCVCLCAQLRYLSLEFNRSMYCALNCKFWKGLFNRCRNIFKASRMKRPDFGDTRSLDLGTDRQELKPPRAPSPDKGSHSHKYRWREREREREIVTPIRDTWRMTIQVSMRKSVICNLGPLHFNRIFESK